LLLKFLPFKAARQVDNILTITRNRRRIRAEVAVSGDHLMRATHLFIVCLVAAAPIGAIGTNAARTKFAIDDARASTISGRFDANRSSGVQNSVKAPGNPDSGSDLPLVRIAQANPVVTTGNPSLAPLKWVGMLTNHAPSARNPNAQFQCTGQFIKPSVILTAGHCINDLTSKPNGPGYDLTKQTFTLQYQNGEGSQVLRTKCALTSPGWKFPPNYENMTIEEQDVVIRAAGQHDFAMILVDGTSATGVMPYDLDWKGKWAAATRVGYPGDILSGQIVQQSRGIVFFVDAIPMFPGESLPNLVAHWQPLAGFTSGSSGGAWVGNYSSMESPNNNFLIAVTSFQNVTFPGVEFGAYLTAAEFNPLLAKVENGCK
jgi:Trypsin